VFGLNMELSEQSSEFMIPSTQAASHPQHIPQYSPPEQFVPGPPHTPTHAALVVKVQVFNVSLEQQAPKGDVGAVVGVVVGAGVRHAYVSQSVFNPPHTLLGILSHSDSFKFVQLSGSVEQQAPVQ